LKQKCSYFEEGKWRNIAYYTKRYGNDINALQLNLCHIKTRGHIKYGGRNKEENYHLLS
jgi:hypothetical protein